MIRRWLAWLRAWWWADLIQRLDHIDARLMALRQLELIDSRLLTLERQRGLPIEPPAVALPPEPRAWGCGHVSVSGAEHGDGHDECLRCHQAAFEAP